MAEKNTIEQGELIRREKAIIDRICSDEHFAYHFFHEKCRPLFSNILWEIYGNNADYDELVNELYLQLKKIDSNGEVWHSLKTYDYRTTLFHWIKTVAVRHFYTPSNDIFTIPDSLIDSGIAEKMFSELRKAVYRKFMWLKYIEQLENDVIAEKLQIEHSQLSVLSRKAIRQFKSVIENSYPDYLNILFRRYDTSEVDIDENSESLPPSDCSSHQEAEIDVHKYLDSMPNERYRYIIKSLFLDDKEPEELAVEMNTPVSNIYNLKSRGIDQLRDVAIHFNEISHLKKYISLISDDRKQNILNSLFIERKSYEEVCSDLKLTEVQFKKLKKDAIKEIKNKIFKTKS